MDSIRYAIALLLIVAVPAAIVFWLLIHPFARFWRRLGAATAYTIVCSAAAVVMATAVALRGRLLAADPGMSIPLGVAGLVCLILSGWLLFKLRQKLTVRVLIGAPELSSDPKSGALITDGIYARVRHPRYVQMTLAVLGYALIANYPAAYGAFLLWCAGIYAVVILEERELAARFGAAYSDYAKRTPRFVPRLRFKQTKQNDK